jgi:hypothetical protein
LLQQHLRWVLRLKDVSTTQFEQLDVTESANGLIGGSIGRAKSNDGPTNLDPTPQTNRTDYITQ